jgi:6-phosphogluconolactonase (cycloisomerase 2 family)
MPPAAERMGGEAVAYAGIGRELTQYAIDRASGALEPTHVVHLPQGVQYAWPHRSRRYLYVACSDGGPGVEGTRHFLCAFRVRPDGALQPHGDPVRLERRPVHLTLDAESRYALATCANPSGIAVHRIRDDGMIGAAVPQSARIELEKTAHQLRFTPSGRTALVPCRGNPPHDGKPEDPGSLRIFDYRDGQLAPRIAIAPDGGYGFGPRHVDFHPSKPWCYMSIERQNEIALFTLEGEQVSGPVSRTTTLAHPEALKPRQLAGAMHVHPNGRFAYVSNRADGTVDWRGEKVFNGGENTIAVYALDAASGEPTLVQCADTHGMHPRTFALDPSGELLVAANMTTRKVRDGEALREVPGGLSVFRVGGDGRLAFLRKLDADVSRETMFWMGIAELPEA